MNKVSIERKRQILDSANGQFFTVEFIKNDGSVRQMTAKKWTEQAFTYGSANAQPNTVRHKPHLYTAVDMEAFKVDPKKSFRNIDLETLFRAKVNGIEYKFD